MPVNSLVHEAPEIDFAKAVVNGNCLLPIAYGTSDCFGLALGGSSETLRRLVIVAMAIYNALNLAGNI
jgi:hypothetical protein